MRRSLLAIAPLVFWNWCQSPESIYRECLFNAVQNVDPIFEENIKSLCRQAAEYSPLDEARGNWPKRDD